MPTKRPNLLLFMPETVRADAAYGPGGPWAHTPHLDRLRAEGTTWTHCYAQSPFCTPSRCATFTGRYPNTDGHRALQFLLRPDERHLFRDLKEAGYRTAVFGKNDLLAPGAVELAFDEVDLQVPREDNGTVDPPPSPAMHRAFYRGRRTGPCHDHDWACVESAKRFLAEPHEQPFCLFLPLHFAHPAYICEEPWFSLYDRQAVTAPITCEVAGKRSYVSRMQKLYGIGDLSDDDLREIRATYFGMISRVDDQLGQLLDLLDELQLTDSTVVVYFSDHGDYAGDFGLVEKYNNGHEECLLHVPLVIRAPGLPAGHQIDGLVELLDLYPTLLELLGLESRHYHYGQSLCPPTDDSPPVREAVFSLSGRRPDEGHQLPDVPPDSFYAPMIKVLRDHPEIFSKSAMIRTETHKYIYCPGDRHELYDLVADPGERVNLAGQPKHAAIEQELRDRLMRWLLECGDATPMHRDRRAWRP